MMDVGVITFHRAINYGAVLQTYALQEELKEHGASCKIIDYHSLPIENYYKPFLVKGVSRKSRIKNSVRALFAYPERKKKMIRVRAFVNKYLDLTIPVNANNVSELNAQFDMFITGSDQVFNTDITRTDADAYFLTFVGEGHARCSYAASFGKDNVTQNKVKLVADALTSFRHISVREPSGESLVQMLTGQEAHTHIDPTLLRHCDAWRAIERRPLGIHGPFIFVYNMLTSAALFETVRNLSRETGLPVYFANPKAIKYKKLYSEFHYRDALSPQEYLWMIDHSAYVLNSSFHGTVFSLLFHKEFLSILPDNEPKNTRIRSLLSMVGLPMRVHEGSVYNDVADLPPIDWKQVDERLDEKRCEAGQYIDLLLKT